MTKDEKIKEVMELVRNLMVESESFPDYSTVHDLKRVEDELLSKLRELIQ